MTSKIFRAVLIASVSVLLATLIIIIGSMSGYFDTVQQKELRDELEIAAAATEKMGVPYLKELQSDRYRLTWIAPDGGIRYDTDVDSGGMENHTDREEVQEALKTGSGSSSRYSSTLTEKTLYEATRLEDGSVLRISVSHMTTLLLVIGMLQPIVVIFLLAVVLAFVLANRMSKKIVRPFNQLDLEHPLENNTYEELAPLLHRIESQHRQIEGQMKELQWKKDEFDQIIRQMREGLVLLDDKGKILSINPAARAIFSAGEFCVGQDFLTVDRSTELSEAMKKAQETGHEELRIHRGGREYQVNITRTASEEQILGTVLLAFDVTEQASAERSRQEFTANVSHELKTPLQSIIGSAELIENGLMKAEDTPRFARNIRKESDRLVHLIDDIIRLSQLDENAAMPMEEVDLSDLTDEVFRTVRDAAELGSVTLLSSGSAVMTGVRRLLFEMLYNLCDNAVKYSRPGGRVEVRLEQDERGVKITVSDTGIGIPEAEQSRVFERFYRVDKSHSKKSGGTGLGLSIVKHVVQYHHGKISLQSREGSGTTITAEFPINERETEAEISDL